MELVLKGEITKLENKVSKKGNEYKVVDFMQPENRYEYFRVMLDREVEIDESFIGETCVAALEYNIKFKSFKVSRLEKSTK